jgi:hypothetical protein
MPFCGLTLLRRDPGIAPPRRPIATSRVLAAVAARRTAGKQARITTELASGCARTAMEENGGSAPSHKRSCPTKQDFFDHRCTQIQSFICVHLRSIFLAVRPSAQMWGSIFMVGSRNTTEKARMSLRAKRQRTAPSGGSVAPRGCDQVRRRAGITESFAAACRSPNVMVGAGSTADTFFLSRPLRGRRGKSASSDAARPTDVIAGAGLPSTAFPKYAKQGVDGEPPPPASAAACFARHVDFSSPSSPDLIRGSPQAPESVGIPGSGPGMTMKRRPLSRLRSFPRMHPTAES